MQNFRTGPCAPRVVRWTIAEQALNSHQRCFPRSSSMEVKLSDWQGSLRLLSPFTPGVPPSQASISNPFSTRQSTSGLTAEARQTHTQSHGKPGAFGTVLRWAVCLARSSFAVRRVRFRSPHYSTSFIQPGRSALSLPESTTALRGVIDSAEFPTICGFSSTLPVRVVSEIQKQTSVTVSIEQVPGLNILAWFSFATAKWLSDQLFWFWWTIIIPWKSDTCFLSESQHLTIHFDGSNDSICSSLFI